MSDQLPQRTEALDVSIRDGAAARSLVNLVPEVIKEAILSVPEDFLHLDEEELRKQMPRGDFSLTDRRLRQAFWMEYQRAQDDKMMMNMAYVYSGICSRQHFYSHVLSHKPRMAYILLQPPNYKIATEEALLFGVNKLRDILDLPIVDAKGKPDSKMADVILRTVEFLDQRVKGAVVQRIQQHNIHQKLPADRSGDEPQTLEDIELKLKELRTKAKTVIGNLAGAIDVTPSREET